MGSPKETIQQEIDKKMADKPEKEKNELKKFASDLTKGKNPKEAMGLSDDYIEGMYSFAYRLYSTGKYDQALQLFQLLVMLDPTQSRYLLGLAACFHMLKEYENASSSYMLCSVVDPDDPLPYYHASDCFIQIENPRMAYDSLKICIAKCGDDEKYKQVKDRAEVSLDILKKSYTPKKNKKNKKKKAAGG
jgi:type III secretion system low calcium response chaperone LcrH/SycD